MPLTFGENFRQAQVPEVPGLGHGLLFSADIASAEVPCCYSGIMPAVLHAAIGAHPIRVAARPYGLHGPGRFAITPPHGFAPVGGWDMTH